jgi:integrase
MGKEWKYLWYNWLKPTRLPGVWKMEKGGHLVRARVTDATTGRMKEIRKVLPSHSEAEAYAWLQAEKDRVKAGLVLATQRKTHFGDYAVSVLENKIAMGELSTRASQDRWRHTLEHLIGGTTSEDGAIVIPGFGDMLVDQIRRSHVEAWRVGVGRLIQAGHYSPNTANSWFAVLRGVLRGAKRDFDLAGVASDGVKDFDTSTHATYTEEEPNSLAAHQVPTFLQKLKEDFPQHYAMAYLGFATGLRPSSLRPLRRSGETPDIQWDAKRILVRRSQTLGKKVRNTTKQGVRYTIDLPEDVIRVLRWHVETQLETDAQRESELLFPSLEGGFRAGTVLTKPFEAVSEQMELGYALTPRGMRRTFNDLARAAQIEDIVTRSISGHATERMQHHYSTVRGDEQRRSIAKVIDLMTARESRPGAPSETQNSQYHSGPENEPESAAAKSSSGTASGTERRAGGTKNRKAS